MDKLSKLEPILILICLIIGFVLSFNSTISNFLGEAEEYLFILLLFFIFLEIDWVNLKEAFLNIKFLKTDLIINFIWTPILTFLLGWIFFSSNIYLRIALTLLLVLPCTDWYLIFTDLTGGNTELSTSILPYNLILQLIILPVCLFLFFSNSNFIINSTVAVETLTELVIPLVLAFIIRLFFKKSESLEEKIHIYSDKIEFILVCLIALAIFGSEGKELINSIKDYPMFIIAIIWFYILNFIISYQTGKNMDFSKEDTVSLVFTTTSRNSPLSLTLAGLLFPQYPLISGVLLIGPLTEIPFSLIESIVLKKLMKSENWDLINKKA